MAGDGRRAWWRNRIVIAVAAVAVAALVVRGCRQRSAKSSDEILRRETVERQDLRVTRTATGEITPQNRVEVKPPIAGRIEQVLVREGDAVTQGQVLAWMSSSDRAALLDAARAQGPEALSRWESAYKAAPLISPLDGTLIVRAVEPGQTVTTADPVVVVADRLIVKAQVDETDIGSINVGQAAAISLDAYPDETVPAQVDHVAYEATTVNNVTIYEVDVLPDQVPEFMRSGMTATVVFVVEAKPGALVVPSEAVHRKEGLVTVRIPGSSPWAKPEHRSVTTGITDGKSVEILSGLTEGDAILVPALRMPRGKSNRGRSPFSPYGSGRPAGGSGNRSRQP
jgi:macrolide-specific efflux system membrane fusion protein